jgi:hypothetical protein
MSLTPCLKCFPHKLRAEFSPTNEHPFSLGTLTRSITEVREYQRLGHMLMSFPSLTSGTFEY